MHHVMSDRSSQLSCLVKETFCDRISSLCLVKECRELEETTKTSFSRGHPDGKGRRPRRVEKVLPRS